jgi:hypothetical protein
VESLFLFIFFNPTDSFDVSVDGRVVILADFGEASCSLLLAILATYSGNALWWKKADLLHDGVRNVICV